jgi:hypothetical protein
MRIADLRSRTFLISNPQSEIRIPQSNGLVAFQNTQPALKAHMSVSKADANEIASIWKSLSLRPAIK